MQANTAILTRDQAQAIVEKALKRSKADAIDVQVNTYTAGNIRFADNQVSTAGSTTGSRSRPSIFDAGPAGLRHCAPTTQRHHFGLPSVGAVKTAPPGTSISGGAPGSGGGSSRVLAAVPLRTSASRTSPAPPPP